MWKIYCKKFYNKQHGFIRRVNSQYVTRIFLQKSYNTEQNYTDVAHKYTNNINDNNVNNNFIHLIS